MAAGRALGREIAEYGLRLVYGGGTKGIMGAVASGVLSGGGQVTGIIPEFLIDMEATRHSLGQLNELIVTPDMHARKHTMFERSDAFVALPGGIGTLEEIVEIMTWAQLGRHRKPILLANINGFWNALTAVFADMSRQGFIYGTMQLNYHVADTVEDILPTIAAAAARLSEAEAIGDAATVRRL